ncbi:MAG: hypothetical protein ABWZ66_01805 [Pyrinomonadaceae bacterium]
MHSRLAQSDKAKSILKARIERFDGDFLFPHNEIDGASLVKILNGPPRETIGKRGIYLLARAFLPGHANFEMIMRYEHPSEERKAGAIRKMQNPKQKQSKRGRSLHF